MKTFNVTKTDEPVLFMVDKDTFEALPADEVPASVLADFFNCIQEGDLFKAHDGFFNTVLVAESYRRFNTRLNSKVNPITVSVLGDIAAWLLGNEYLGGKSYGRSQVIINFALDSWEELGSWCLLHGVNTNIWRMPGYQLGGLVMAFLKDDAMPESIKEIDDSFKMSDSAMLPFESPEFRAIVMAMCRVITASKSKSTVTIDNVIYDSRLVPELPVEERKRREAAEKGKAYRVPDWWQGEQKAYKIASSMMGVLPKKGGDPG